MTRFQLPAHRRVQHLTLHREQRRITLREYQALSSAERLNMIRQSHGKEKYDLYEGVIVSKDATYLGDLINTPSPAVNNGMIVSLTNGTIWTVTGTSYLTGLTIDESSITAPEGYNVEMTVNGVKTKIETDKTYTGDIVLSLSNK